MQRDTVTFTTSDQIARDMRTGIFPAMSEQTKAELADRERIFNIAFARLSRGYKAGEPTSAQHHMWCAMALDIAVESVPAQEEPLPEYNGGDTPPV